MNCIYMHRAVIFAGIVAAVAAVAGYIVYQQINRPPFALEVDAIKDTTDIGIQYRIRMTNVGTQQLTGIIVELGANDIQEKSFLNPGQSYYFYPDPETQVSKVRVKTNEGIMIESDYRSPTKVLGLPGAGR
ncbi:hypothetical protein [Candidatus Nitrososphaera gargensis]|nr:hypothetical protein [Candidatus Nitrososphaera gargensis]